MGLKEDILAQHTFTFPSLSPNSHSHKQPYIRFLMFLTKRADISDEKFHMWWSTVHADLLLSVKEYGGYASRYVQVRFKKLRQHCTHRVEVVGDLT